MAVEEPRGRSRVQSQATSVPTRATSGSRSRAASTATAPPDQSELSLTLQIADTAELPVGLRSRFVLNDIVYNNDGVRSVAPHTFPQSDGFVHVELWGRAHNFETWISLGHLREKLAGQFERSLWLSVLPVRYGTARNPLDAWKHSLELGLFDYGPRVQIAFGFGHAREVLNRESIKVCSIPLADNTLGQPVKSHGGREAIAGLRDLQTFCGSLVDRLNEACNSTIASPTNVNLWAGGGITQIGESDQSASSGNGVADHSLAAAEDRVKELSQELNDATQRSLAADEAAAEATARLEETRTNAEKAAADRAALVDQLVAQKDRTLMMREFHADLNALTTICGDVAAVADAASNSESFKVGAKSADLGRLESLYRAKATAGQAELADLRAQLAEAKARCARLELIETVGCGRVADSLAARNLEARVVALEVDADARDSPPRDARVGGKRIVNPTVSLGAMDRDMSLASGRRSGALKANAWGPQHPRPIEASRTQGEKQPSFGALPWPSSNEKVEDESTPEPWCPAQGPMSKLRALTAASSGSWVDSAESERKTLPLMDALMSDAPAVVFGSANTESGASRSSVQGNDEGLSTKPYTSQEEELNKSDVQATDSKVPSFPVTPNLDVRSSEDTTVGESSMLGSAATAPQSVSAASQESQNFKIPREASDAKLEELASISSFKIVEAPTSTSALNESAKEPELMRQTSQSSTHSRRSSQASTVRKTSKKENIDDVVEDAALMLEKRLSQIEQRASELLQLPDTPGAAPEDSKPLSQTPVQNALESETASGASPSPQRSRTVKESPKEVPRESPKQAGRESAPSAPEEVPKESPKPAACASVAKEPSAPKEVPKELPKPAVSSSASSTPKESPKESPKPAASRSVEKEAPKAKKSKKEKKEKEKEPPASESAAAAVHTIPEDSGDALDKALAAYLSTRPTRAAFAKIGAGKYTYGGSKKLFLKFSEDKGITVRAGGSLVPIEDYLIEQEGPPPAASGTGEADGGDAGAEGEEDEEDDLAMFAGMGNAYENV